MSRYGNNDALYPYADTIAMSPFGDNQFLPGGYQPRSIHSSRWGRSLPIVVSSP